MKFDKKIYSILLVFASVFLFGQKNTVAKGDREYANFAYINAIDIYLKVVEKGYESAEIYQKIGNSYYFNAKLTEANQWYEKLFALKNVTIEPEYYYRYSQTLKATGNYEKANAYLSDFSKMNASDNRAKLFNDSNDYLAEIKKRSGRFTVEDSGINSEFSDYGGAFNNDKIVFTSTRKSKELRNKTHQWTNQPYSNLYEATLTSEGLLASPVELNKKINSNFNESTAVFTKDGKTMYFTRNNFTDKKVKTDKNQVMLLKLYKAVLKDNEWTEVQELPFNSDEYNCAHPALSTDEKTLFFVSNMPGTIGQSDIFKVALHTDGTFGKPENLGKEFNTEGRESFPYISKNNEIYFASDGRPGLGGLDIFAAKMSNDGSFAKIYNVGAPVNSPFDDFAYMLAADSNGFFASNRDGGKGYDDIYKFKENLPLPFNCKQLLKGVLTDIKTNAIIPNAKIVLFDDKMNPLTESVTNDKGEYSFPDLECDKKYVVRGVPEKYEAVEKAVLTDLYPGETTSSLEVDSFLKKIEVGTDLAKTFGIDLIYFDLDKANIRKISEKDLAKILEVLQRYPAITINIKSHTDSRQSASYNLKLSQRRAQSTMQWFLNKGIDKSRLTSEGLGESQLLNQCADGVKCSEEEHQKNRRSEFIITGM